MITQVLCGLAAAVTAGLDRAAQTPAVDHLPSFVPGPAAGVPTVGALTGTSGATGTHIATDAGGGTSFR